MICGPTAATGVTELDGAESGPVPTTFTARTWKVYAVPLVSPVTVQLVALAGMPVMTGSVADHDLEAGDGR